MSEAPKVLVELDRVTKIYHRTRGGRIGRRSRSVVALSEVTLSVNQGEIFGLVGESGSGKTTAGRLIVGLEGLDSGRIKVGGQELKGLKGAAVRAYRRQVQMVFQDPYQSLNPQLTILDSVAEPLINFRVAKAAEREGLVREMLGGVGLSPAEDFIYRFPHQLSGGQRQRVAIARAMMIRPSCLVADEPTSMLDASYSAHIFDILLKMRARFATTIIFITHSLAAARYLCDRVAVIFRGHLMEIGPAGAVIADPRHPYSQALIDATPKFGHCNGQARYATLLSAERVAGEEAGCAFFRRCARAQRAPCSLQAPALVEIAPGRLVACHFASAGDRPATEINPTGSGRECCLGG